MFKQRAEKMAAPSAVVSEATKLAQAATDKATVVKSKARALVPRAKIEAAKAQKPIMQTGQATISQAAESLKAAAPM